MRDAPTSFPRRKWLSAVLQASIAATLAAILYPVVRFLWPRAATSSGALEVIAPYRIADLKPDADGQWPPPFEFNGKPCLLVPTAEGAKKLAAGAAVKSDDLRAFNAICTHVACTVEYRPAEGDIFCNCHNGVYDLNGRNVSGPPPRPLQEYRVEIRPAKTAGQEEIVVFRST